MKQRKFQNTCIQITSKENITFYILSLDHLVPILFRTKYSLFSEITLHNIASNHGVQNNISSVQSAKQGKKWSRPITYDKNILKRRLNCKSLLKFNVNIEN